MKDKIERARSETIYSDGRQRYIFLKEDLDSLLKEVAEKQRDIDYAIARPINKDIAGLISITPLVTDKIK